MHFDMRLGKTGCYNSASAIGQRNYINSYPILLRTCVRCKAMPRQDRGLNRLPAVWEWESRCIAGPYCIVYTGIHKAWRRFAHLYFRVHYDGGTGTEFMPTSSARVLAGPICQLNTMESGVSGDGMKKQRFLYGCGSGDCLQ